MMTTRTQLVTSISHIWLVLWLVSIPLVHIHPEADHAHGTQKHKHGGIFHSVLSKDLACEFHSHTSYSPPSLEKNSRGFLHCEHADAHLLNHDEIGFSLLSSSSNDSSQSHESPIFLLASPALPSRISPSIDRSFSSERSPPPQLYVSLYRIRPPPILSA